MKEQGMLIFDSDAKPEGKIASRPSLKATVLVDNISGKAPDGRELGGEWGLAMFIEYGGKKILLDTGASGSLLARNAALLGVDLAEVDFGVLSHAHFDHANGMSSFFEANRTAKFYLSSNCSENCYGKKWIFKRYIGIRKNLLSEFSDRIEYVDGVRELSGGIYIVPHSTKGLADIGRRENMYVRADGKWRPDDFSHEQSLVFDTEGGLVIFNSCSHAGVENIISEVMSALPDKKVLAMIGGFHLFNKSREFVISLADKIASLGIRHIYTGHCTGSAALEILSDRLGGIVNPLHTGLVISF